MNSNFCSLTFRSTPPRFADRKSEGCVGLVFKNPVQIGVCFVLVRPLVFGQILGFASVCVPWRFFGSGRLVVQWSGSSSMVRFSRWFSLRCLGLRASWIESEFRLGIRSIVRCALDGALGSVLPRRVFAGSWCYTPPPPGR